MEGEYGHAVQEPLGGSVGLRQVDNHLIRAELSNLDGLSPHLQKVSLRRVNLLIQVDLEAEQHVISIKRVAIGKRDAPPQLERVVFSVPGNLPGLRQRPFCTLRGEIDVNQIRKEERNQLFLGKVDGSYRVESLRFRAQRRYEPPTPSPAFVGSDKNIFT